MNKFINKRQLPVWTPNILTKQHMFMTLILCGAEGWTEVQSCNMNVKPNTLACRSRLMCIPDRNVWPFLLHCCMAKPPSCTANVLISSWNQMHHWYGHQASQFHWRSIILHYSYLPIHRQYPIYELILGLIHCILVNHHCVENIWLILCYRQTKYR